VSPKNAKLGSEGRHARIHKFCRPFFIFAHKKFQAVPFRPTHHKIIYIYLFISSCHLCFDPDTFGACSNASEFVCSTQTLLRKRIDIEFLRGLTHERGWMVSVVQLWRLNRTLLTFLGFVATVFSVQKKTFHRLK
jgi:hypothetical protein